MTTVLEIGCGLHPNPRFQETAQHFILDPDKHALDHASRKHPDFTPILGRADDLSCFDDESLDIVIASNLFGDAFLGIGGKDREALIDLQSECLSTGQIQRFMEISARASIDSDPLKLSIMQEIGRTIRCNGKLIVIETISPPIAAAFFGDQEFIDGLHGIVMEKRKLAQIAPSSYTQHYEHEDWYESWLGIKAS